MTFRALSRAPSPRPVALVLFALGVLSDVVPIGYSYANYEYQRSRLPLAGKPSGYIRRQRHQLQVVPAIQWQLHDALVLDHGADGCVVANQQCRVGSDFD